MTNTLFPVIRLIWRIIHEWSADIWTEFHAENLEIVDRLPGNIIINS